jgi:HSP20 family molecular chaperone IbpA
MPTRSPKAASKVKVVSAAAIDGHVQSMYGSIARRAYEIYERTGRVSGHESDHWFQAESELFQPLAPQQSENEKAIVIRTEVPGFVAAEIEVGVEPGRVLIAGKHRTSSKRKSGKAHIAQQSSQEIFRFFELPAGVNPALAAASLKDGVLTVTIPKT